MNLKEALTGLSLFKDFVQDGPPDNWVNVFSDSTPVKHDISSCRNIWYDMARSEIYLEVIHQISNSHGFDEESVTAQLVKPVVLCETKYVPV